MCESRQHRLGTVTAGKGFTPIPLLRQFRMAAPRVARKLPHGDRAVAWQESLLRALVLAYPVAIPKLLEGDGGSRHAAAALASVGTLLGRCTSDKEAKALSGELRQLSVQERPSSVPILRGVLSLRGFTVPEQGRILFQLSRFGRAGPYAQQDAVHTAEEQHRTDLTRQFPVPRRLRKSAFRFAARWSHGKASSPAKVSFGASAGSDSSRAKGGWRAVVKTVTDEFRSTLLTREDCVEINTLVGPWVGPLRSVTYVAGHLVLMALGIWRSRQIGYCFYGRSSMLRTCRGPLALGNFSVSSCLPLRRAFGRAGHT